MMAITAVKGGEGGWGGMGWNPGVVHTNGGHHDGHHRGGGGGRGAPLFMLAYSKFAALSSPFIALLVDTHAPPDCINHPSASSLAPSLSHLHTETSPHPQGSRPVIFFTRHGKDSVRMVVPGMEGNKAAEKLKWGLKLKLDVKKPVIGLAAHPREQQLVALFGDGALRGYALGQGGLVPTFTLPGEEGGMGGGGREDCKGCGCGACFACVHVWRVCMGVLRVSSVYG